MNGTQRVDGGDSRRRTNRDATRHAAYAAGAKQQPKQYKNIPTVTAVPANIVGASSIGGNGRGAVTSSSTRVTKMVSDDSSSSSSKVKSFDERERNVRERRVEEFWKEKMEEMRKIDSGTYRFRHQDIPLARIKRIMKLDEDVQYIAYDVPMLFAKACELFIADFAKRSWTHTMEAKRKTVQRLDLANVLTDTNEFDFLIDILPNEEDEDDADDEEIERASAKTKATSPAALAEAIPAALAQNGSAGPIVMGANDGRPAGAGPGRPDSNDLVEVQTPYGAVKLTLDQARQYAMQMQSVTAMGNVGAPNATVAAVNVSRGRPTPTNASATDPGSVQWQYHYNKGEQVAKKK